MEVSRGSESPVSKSLCYRNFVILDNVSALKELAVIQKFTHQITARAAAMVAFHHCVSQLSGPVTIAMVGWLLDTEALKMSSIMMKHP